MEKRIRLNNSVQAIPDKVKLCLLLLLGSGYLIIGVNSFIENGLSFHALFTNTFGLVIVMYGVIYFGFFLPWTPQVYINNERVIIKPGLFEKTTLIRWANVSQLKLGIQRVSFKVDGAYQDFKLSVSSAVSKDVKKSLREVATLKHIPVIGG